MNSRLQELIDRGIAFSFSNNSHRTDHGIYSRASEELLAWIAEIEHYLINNYEKESGPFNLFYTMDRRQLSGNYQDSFERQLQTLRGVLFACKNISPNKRRKHEDNLILSLLKNPAFWAVTVVLIGGSFTLGFYTGNTKFDSNLIELAQAKKDLTDSIHSEEGIILRLKQNSDSALNILSHISYDEMKLDTFSYRMVQTTIENVGAVLYLNR